MRWEEENAPQEVDHPWTTLKMETKYREISRALSIADRINCTVRVVSCWYCVTVHFSSLRAIWVEAAFTRSDGVTNWKFPVPQPHTQILDFWSQRIQVWPWRNFTSFFFLRFKTAKLRHEDWFCKSYRPSLLSLGVKRYVVKGKKH